MSGSSQRLYIAAGNHQQAVYWADRWGLASGDWRYVTNERTLRGLHDIRYRIVGTFYDRSDAHAIREALLMVNAQEVPGG